MAWCRCVQISVNITDMDQLLPHMSQGSNELNIPFSMLYVGKMASYDWPNVLTSVW